MRDYAFGNRLSALRQERGYSQFQLAGLVGVSDKAVSKWETGSAKPRMETCQRLTAVLGVDMYDLFSQNELNSSVGGYFMNKNLLWKAAEERLYNLYGENPDLSVIDRFLTEKTFLQGTDAIVLFSAIACVRKIAEEHHAQINARGALNGSFTAWLMGATIFNPLPPHTRCSKCRSVYFHPEVSDGFDLPATVCHCGNPLIRDGHALPFETYLDKVKISFCTIECNIPTAIISEAWHEILTFLQKYYTCERYVTRQSEETGYPGEFSRLYLHPGNTGTVFQTIEEVPEISDAIRTRNRNDVSSIYFFNDNMEGMIYESFPAIEELLSPSVLHQAMKKNCAPTYYLEDINSFYDLVQAEAASHATFREGFDPVQFAADHGLPSFTALPLTREEVWLTITRACPEATGIAAEILHNLRLSRYMSGIIARDPGLMLRMGLPSWFAEYVSSVAYLFPKSHCVDFAYRDLVASWSKSASV